MIASVLLAVCIPMGSVLPEDEKDLPLKLWLEYEIAKTESSEESDWSYSKMGIQDQYPEYKSSKEPPAKVDTLSRYNERVEVAIGVKVTNWISPRFRMTVEDPTTKWRVEIPALMGAGLQVEAKVWRLSIRQEVEYFSGFVSSTDHLSARVLPTTLGYDCMPTEGVRITVFAGVVFADLNLTQRENGRDLPGEFRTGFGRQGGIRVQIGNRPEAAGYPWMAWFAELGLRNLELRYDDNSGGPVRRFGGLGGFLAIGGTLRF